ncbi:hypothetical protein GF407_18335 [candidate division KSB1 bacterium]|nr:hypothetical protein [candidate division KSB1 bacterium]
MRRIVLFTVFSFYCCTFSQTLWQPNEFNPIIRNYFDPDSDCLFRPCIVYHAREYHMWYSKVNSESEQMIGYARSLDGIQWTLISDKVIAPSKDLNRFDTYQASQGWVLVDQDTFKMWYGVDNKDILNYATSNWITKISAIKTGKNGKDGIVQQNFPNPCNTTTFIPYRLKRGRDVNISLYDIRGCHIKTLVDDIHQAGNYCYRLDGTNLCSGIYYYICNVEGKIHCREMVVVK